MENKKRDIKIKIKEKMLKRKEAAEAKRKGWKEFRSNRRNETYNKEKEEEETENMKEEVGIKLNVKLKQPKLTFER